MEVPIKISPEALQAIQAIREKKQIGQEYALRIGIKGRNCSKATQFLLGFDKPHPTDLQFMIENIPILVDKRQLMYVIGVEIVYIANEKGEKGFSFQIV
ncbi:MAG: iron-sulfur cluster assembly accessory protein [Microscillaceae bacterium]|nr:iron-sulfur cluster assembly accessory protein [Microscillaceae bacterium]MDW8460287.1 iron-sulfur cluster biosynthesis family protein [Cytophagales bacterium]